MGVAFSLLDVPVGCGGVNPHYEEIKGESGLRYYIDLTEESALGCGASSSVHRYGILSLTVAGGKSLSSRPCLTAAQVFLLR